MNTEIEGLLFPLAMICAIGFIVLIAAGGKTRQTVIVVPEQLDQGNPAGCVLVIFLAVISLVVWLAASSYLS